MNALFSSEESIATIADVLKSLANYVTNEEATVIVQREHVLDDALRTVRRGSFSVDHTIIVRRYFTLGTTINCVCYCK